MKKLLEAMNVYEAAHNRAEAARRAPVDYAATPRLEAAERKAAHDLYRELVKIITSEGS